MSFTDRTIPDTDAAPGIGPATALTPAMAGAAAVVPVDRGHGP